ncbi:MAG: ATP-binding protein [Nitratireductor sp.]|uniref:ATP-binding protein n=1 Tax=Alphaproteobacteria TaxID=28211 RepID=UPI0032895CCC
MTPRKNISVGPFNGNVTIACVVGPPGAGKTTFARQLSGIVGCPTLTMSAFMREVAAQDASSKLSNDINYHMSNGLQLDSIELYEKLLTSVTKKKDSVQIIDGFPRTNLSAEFLMGWCEAHDFSIVTFHVFTTLELCRQRFLSKSGRENNHAIFNVRIQHYSKIEREALSVLSIFPVINVRT